MTVIEKEGAEFDNMMNKLEVESVIGFDGENRSFTPKGTVAEIVLMQIATEKEVFLIRCFNGRISNGKLNELTERILNNPNILVIGFDLTNDLKALSLKVREITNTDSYIDLEKLYEANKYDAIFRHCEVQDISLSKLSYILTGYYIDKICQMSPWTIDELTMMQKIYASIDALVYLEMFKILVESLGREKCVKYNMSNITFEPQQAPATQGAVRETGHPEPEQAPKKKSKSSKKKKAKWFDGYEEDDYNY